MPRVRLTLAYLGTGFSGWQVQDAPRSVQGCLEEVLTRLCQGPVRVHAAGRTDAGVHALGQVVHFDVPAGRAHLPWQRACNAMLPRDMTVLDAAIAPPEFHARFDARSKTYSYTLWLEPGYVLPQRRALVWAVGPLDLESMRRAAGLLTGERDFAAFRNLGTPVCSTVRRLMAVECRPSDQWPEVVWRFTADGFLKQMVRNLVGCLVDVGRGRLSPEDMLALAEGLDRRALPATAPPQGLCLESVDY